MATPVGSLGRSGGAGRGSGLLPLLPLLLLLLLPTAAQQAQATAPRTYGLTRRNRLIGGAGGPRRRSDTMLPMRPVPDHNAPFIPKNTTDKAAWYPEFKECSANSVPKLEYPTGHKERSPCVQLPLPPKSARFQETEAKPGGPTVNTTQPGYLFVLGTPYGGTTAFLGLLSSSPKVTVPNAGWAHEMQWNMIGAKPPVYPFMRRTGMKYGPANKLWGIKEDPLIDPEEFDVQAHKFWDTQKPIKVDKSHNLALFADKLYLHFRAKGSVVKFIILARHPCTYGAQPRTYGAHLRRVRRFRRVMEDHPEDSLLVFYEDFVTDPKGTADKILRFFPELERLDEADSQLEGKMTTLGDGKNVDRGLATGGEQQKLFKKKYVDDRMKRSGFMRQFSLSWCEGFPPSRKEILPAEGLDLLRYYGWLK